MVTAGVPDEPLPQPSATEMTSDLASIGPMAHCTPSRASDPRSAPAGGALCWGMRLLVVVLVLCSLPVAAEPRKVTAEQAVRVNKQSFDRALAKRKLERIKLAASPAAAQQVTDARAVVLTLFSNARDDEPVFVVDENKQVFRVIRAPKKLGRVPITVCHAGPVSRAMVQFALPAGHTYQGELKLAYDAYELWPQNTCR